MLQPTNNKIWPCATILIASHIKSLQTAKRTEAEGKKLRGPGSLFVDEFKLFCHFLGLKTGVIGQDKKARRGTLNPLPPPLNTIHDPTRNVYLEKSGGIVEHVFGKFKLYSIVLGKSGWFLSFSKMYSGRKNAFIHIWWKIKTSLMNLFVRKYECHSSKVWDGKKWKTTMFSKIKS